MANFDPIYVNLMRDEGGFVLHKVAGDSGGWTYGGIARNYHKDWPGWRLIDNGVRSSEELSKLVREFYVREFWLPLKGDQLIHQDVANMLFSFSVNASSKVAVKLAQTCVGVVADGVLGPKSLAALNDCDPLIFKPNFAIAAITLYVEICNRNRTQSKFLLGWRNRILKML